MSTDLIKVFNTTLVMDTNALADGDVALDDTKEIENVFRVHKSRALLHSLVLLDPDDQGAAMDLVFMRSEVSLGTTNSAVSISDTNAAEIIAVVSIVAGQYVDLIGSQIVTLNNLGIVLESDPATQDRSLYVGVIMREGATYAGAALKLKLGIMRD